MHLSSILRSIATVFLALVLVVPVMRAGEPPKELTPEEMKKLNGQMSTLALKTFALINQSKFSEAAENLKKVVEIERQLFPAAKYPDGHAMLAATLNNTGSMYLSAGQYDQAVSYIEQSLAMNRKLYPASKYP
ncbi:MAG TPA: tetratricopeptide repeat protein, partial [Gemmataceae bacterium]|nr:tetratricopeptide repeat protein [Gemmataceae bacterium]